MDPSPSTPRPSSALGHALSTLKRTFASPRRPSLSSSSSTSSPAPRSSQYATQGPSHHARGSSSSNKIPSVSDIAMGLHRSRTPHLGPSVPPLHHSHVHAHGQSGTHTNEVSRRASLGARAQSYPAPQSPTTPHRRPGLSHTHTHSHTLVPAPPPATPRRTNHLLTPTKSSMKKQKPTLSSSSHPVSPPPPVPHLPTPSVQSTQSLTSTLLSSSADTPISPTKLYATSPTRGGGVKARFTRLLRPSGPPPVRTVLPVGHDHDALNRARATRGGGPPSMESSRTSFEDGTLVSSAGTMRSGNASDDTHGHGHGVRKAVRFAFKEGYE